MKHTWNLVKPVVVLGVLCLVVSVALAFTNGLTADIIYERENADTVAARRQLLPDAEEFEIVEESFDGVQDIAVADTGEVVITGVAAGYGGDVPVMVAFDGDAIVAAQVLEISETPGVGDQIVTNPDFIGRHGGPALPRGCGGHHLGRHRLLHRRGGGHQQRHCRLRASQVRRAREYE